MPRLSLLALLACLVVLAGCAAPEGLEGEREEPEPPGPVETDDRIHTVQLYQTGEEVSLPILSLREQNSLTLEFDVVGTTANQPLDVQFRRVPQRGEQNLVPTEYLTGFDRDEIFDSDPSGNTAVPYVHYRYTFPNTGIGFRLGGVYTLTVSDPGGPALFERTFFVTEDLVETEMLLGSRLAEAGAVGQAIQPSARLRPLGALANEDPFQFTVCFFRDGQVDALRCSQEPSIAELAVFGFYLPRSEAFQPVPPIYRLDLGVLGLSPEVEEVDVVAMPPTALMQPDFAAFGGEIFDPVLLSGAAIDNGYREAGRADDEAEYVDVTFRYVPPGERELPGPVYVRGGFTEGKTSARNRLEWRPDEKRYVGTVLVKQGIYAYDFPAPRAPPSRQPVALGQPSVYTALVFYQDLTRFADRLVGVQSAVAR
ncbi:MAG: type IX secretion system plug protein domain-containing protein [Bacteroidota bacterium]